MFRSRPSHSRLPLFHCYFCVSSCLFANLCRPIDVNFICFWYTWDRNVLLQNLASKNPTRTSLPKLSFCLKMLDIADGHQLIELLIQRHRLGLSCGRCSILTNFPSSDHAIPPVFCCCFFLSNITKTFHTKFIHAKIMTIQIRWKNYLALIQLLVIISQQNLAHTTSALDSLQHKGVSKCRIYLVHQVIKSWAKIKMG